MCNFQFEARAILANGTQPVQRLHYGLKWIQCVWINSILSDDRKALASQQFAASQMCFDVKRMYNPSTINFVIITF